MSGSATTTARIAPTLSRRPLVERLAAASTLLTVMTAMSVSSIALIALGVPYGAGGGSQLFKIHPATYMAFVSLVLWTAAAGGPGRMFSPIALARPGILALTAATMVLLFHAVVIVKLSTSPIVDTFLAPVMVLPCLMALPSGERRWLEWAVHAFMTLNALLGIFEAASGWRLTPMYDTDGVTLMAYEWRSSALLGHPLANAFHTGAYLVALAGGASPRLPLVLRFALMAISALALVVFGGRTAMLVAYLMVPLIASGGAVRVILGSRFPLGRAMIGIAALTAGVIIAVLFVEGGGADRALSRFVEDHGSAQTRISMLRVYDHLSWDQFLLWPNPDLIWQAQREFSLRIGIESTEFGLTATYGLLVATLLMIACGLFLRDLVHLTNRKSWWLVIYFVILMSASNGLSAKNINFAIYMTMVFAIMDKPPIGRRRSGAVGDERST